MEMLTNNWIDYLIVVGYLLVTVGIGIYFSRDKRNSETYLLGGRTLPPWLVGIACMMSMFSSISIVSTPGEIFNNSFSLLSLSLLYPFLSIPAYFLFAKFWFKLGSFTPYEYLEYRYDKGVRGVVAFSSFYLRVIYIGMVLYTSSKIFEGAFGWPAWFSILLTASVGIASCFMGGSKAVIWTDLFQAIITFGGLIAIIGIAAWKIDGHFFSGITIAWQDGHGLTEYAKPEFYSFTPYERVLFWLLLWGIINNILVDACSNQVVIQRILSTKNWIEGLKSQIYSNGLGLLSTIILVVIGFQIYTFYKQNPVEGLHGDIALFHFVKNHVPQPLSGLFMAAMLAAIMSTVSGVVNSLAGVWVKEFHIKFINKGLDEEGEFKLLRKTTLIIGIIGILLALGLDFSGKWLRQSVVEVGTLFYLLGTAILPAYMHAVISRKANSALIWAITFFGLAEGLTWNVWYALSRSSKQAWVEATKGMTPEQASQVDFGWAGPLEFKYIVPFIVIMVVCFLPYIFRKYKWSWAILPLIIVAAVIAIPAFSRNYGFATINNYTVYFAVLAIFLIFKNQLETFFKSNISKNISALIGCMGAGAVVGLLVWYAFSNALIGDIPQERSFAFTIPIPFILSFILLYFCPVQPKEKYQGLTLDSWNEEILMNKKEEQA